MLDRNTTNNDICFFYLHGKARFFVRLNGKERSGTKRSAERAERAGTTPERRRNDERNEPERQRNDSELIARNSILTTECFYETNSGFFEDIFKKHENCKNKTKRQYVKSLEKLEIE